jgi:hypothetical protein
MKSGSLPYLLNDFEDHTVQEEFQKLGSVLKPWIGVKI